MSKRTVFTDPRLCRHLRKRAGVCKTSLANAAMTVGAVDTSPTTRYVHNALGQRLFKTEPQFPPATGDENDPAFMASLIAFFSNLWGGNTGAANPSASEKLGFQYYYDEDGSLLYELGSGGASSTGAAHYVYLPTPSGPMPIAFYNGSKHYAIHTDHLNTPRRLTNSSKQVAWQWAFSAFGDELPTLGKNRYVDPTNTPNAGSTTIADVTFNLRYPGQYFDKESNLHYNYFRSYDARSGRYTQSDPIGLGGGWNKFGYAYQNPLRNTDPRGLAVPFVVAACMANPACVAAAVAATAATAKACIDTYDAVRNWVRNQSSEGGDNPSLLDPKGENHVLGGDATGGGHRPGTGRPGKSEFPSGWSDDRITGEISDVATDPGSSRTPGRGGRTVVNGTRGGVNIDVIIEPNGRIVTGYPTNLPRNPR